MVKVSRRGGFPDRQGIKSENTEIQLKDLDTRTRTQIYNLLSEQYKFIYQILVIGMKLFRAFLDILVVKSFAKKSMQEIR